MTRSVAALTGMFSSLLGVLALIGSLTSCCCGACCVLGGSLEGCRLSGGGIGPGLWGKFATRRPLSAAFEVSWICGVGATLLASFLELSSISPSSFSASAFAGSIKGPLESRLALRLAWREGENIPNTHQLLPRAFIGISPNRRANRRRTWFRTCYGRSKHLTFCALRHVPVSLSRASLPPTQYATPHRPPSYRVPLPQKKPTNLTIFSLGRWKQKGKG